MKKTTLEAIGKENPFQLIGKDWMLVTAGNEFGYNTMTASWGGVGWLWNKPVAFIFIRPERYTHDFLETNERVTLSFYAEEYRQILQICGTKSGRDINKTAETGLVPVALESGSMTFEQARLTLDCRKLFKTSMHESDFVEKSILNTWYGEKGGLHDIYVAEIENVYTE